MTVELATVVPQRLAPPVLGGEIQHVAPGSPAERAGIRAGERLVAINGLVPRDLIDYMYETDVERLELVVEGAGRRRRVRIRKAPGEDLGIALIRPVFEGIRECNNNCEFCFIRGLPKGLRRSLYIRDDDYRYSFLFGTFLTLTNLSEADWQRIGYQHLSPLHVSVHATDLATRRRMLANPAAPDILRQLDRLGEFGVEVKAQVVLCPGLNDGAILEQTVRDLGARPHVVDSVAIVPVGLTRYSSARGLRPVQTHEARAVVQSARRWQRDFRRRLGRDFVYLSDEFYLLAGEPFPPAHRYDGFRQLQNGVGLTRLLLEEWKRARARLPAALPAPRCVVWLCGRAARPALEAMAADAAAVRGLTLQVLEVPNDFFGGGVTVSGLLAGRDIVTRLRGVAADLAILPRSAFGFEGRETLDGWTVEALQKETDARLALASTAAELVETTLSG